MTAGGSFDRSTDEELLAALGRALQQQEPVPDEASAGADDEQPGEPEAVQVSGILDVLQAGSGFLRQLRDEGRRLAAAWLRAPDVPPAPATLTAQPA